MRMKWAKGFPGTAAFFEALSTSVIACGEASFTPKSAIGSITKASLPLSSANGHITFKKATQPSTFSVIPALTTSLHATFKSPIPNGRAARALILSADRAYIETEFSPETAEITTLLNGKIVQHSPVSAMMHGIDKLICYITQCMTLLPGDIIATGTPSGIGSMQRGDTVEVRITGLGTLRNTVR